jgi:hypothetical protein
MDRVVLKREHTQTRPCVLLATLTRVVLEPPSKKKTKTAEEHQARIRNARSDLRSSVRFLCVWRSGRGDALRFGLLKVLFVVRVEHRQHGQD